MPKIKPKRKKVMGKSRGGFARNGSGLLRFTAFSIASSGNVLTYSWILDGAVTGNYAVWLNYSLNGAAFARATDSVNNVDDVSDLPSGDFGAPVFVEDDYVGNFLTVTDDKGELLARSATLFQSVTP